MKLLDLVFRYVVVPVIALNLIAYLWVDAYKEALIRTTQLSETQLEYVFVLIATIFFVYGFYLIHKFKKGHS